MLQMQRREYCAKLLTVLQTIAVFRRLRIEEVSIDIVLELNWNKRPKAAVALLTSRDLSSDFRPAARLPGASQICRRSLYRNAPNR
jgi:hypothetical protein